jgi:hypothetical protein
MAESAPSGLPFSILTDIPSAAEWHKRCRQACGKVKTLDELLTMIEQRSVPTEQGGVVTLTDDDITLPQAELLFYLVTQTKPILTVETGFNHGLAASIITAAHVYNGLKGGHVPIQEQPRSFMDGIGFYTIERLDLPGYQIMEHETGMVLPQMYLQKLNDGLSFVYFNSATEFDEQMMEYFYLGRLLNEGGIIAINTAAPARQQLVDYIRASRSDYAIRDVGNSITLVQTPHRTELAGHNPKFRH